MEIICLSACTQSLLHILKTSPFGKSIAIDSNTLATTLIHDYTTILPIMYTVSIHDIYSIVYTETTESKIALHVYTEYQSRLCPGGKLIYYIDFDRQSVNVALHTISTEDFEITYFSHFMVFTKCASPSTKSSCRSIVSTAFCFDE